MGLQDWNPDWTDSKLLKGTLKLVHFWGFTQIKIIFCVQGITKDRKGPFTRPAQFIGSLKVEEEAMPITDEVSDDEDDDDKEDENDDDMDLEVEDGSIWESVLIIKREGRTKKTRKEQWSIR